ncbi:MAG: DUF4062 domain-containing protein [Nitrospirae bacterium]|nr:DUF4062 domain-containing protein [Nitrospirota bacterium]
MGEDVKVYISSTYEDLKDYRDAVMKALRKIEAQHVNMEDYYAKDDRPVDVCLADVAKCDIYVGIFARRYGFIPDDYTQSITELEYRKAVELNKPTFNFLLKDEVDWPNQYCAIDNDKRWLNKLKDELKGKKTVAWFTGCHDLAQEVMAAVAGHQKKIIRLQIGKGMSDQFANLGVADTPEKKAAIEDVLVASKEKMWQSSNRQLQTWCEPIPVPLPKLRGTFVGRETEQETLLHCLNYTDKRLVVIIAPGGYGKTELTTKVLREIAPKTTITNKDIQGILYLRCSIAGDVNMGTVFTEAGKIAGTVEAFFNVYKNREISNAKRLEYFFKELSIIGNVWIVLDNFEDLLDADDTIKDAELREFLETAVSIDHTIRIIITSRVLPKFKGDRLVEKIDLSEGLPEEKAVEYLRKEGAEYGLRDEDKSILLAFVRRVHRIPKALESGIGYLSEHFPGIKLKDILANDGIFLDFDKHDHKEGLKSLIMEQIKRLHPNLQLVLSVLSIFSKPTPQEALRYMLQGMSYVELAQNLTRLERNRLITHNNGNYDIAHNHSNFHLKQFSHLNLLYQ